MIGLAGAVPAGFASADPRPQPVLPFTMRNMLPFDVVLISYANGQQPSYGPRPGDVIKRGQLVRVGVQPPAPYDNAPVNNTVTASLRVMGMEGAEGGDVGDVNFKASAWVIRKAGFTDTYVVDSQASCNASPGIKCTPTGWSETPDIVLGS